MVMTLLFISHLCISVSASLLCTSPYCPPPLLLLSTVDWPGKASYWSRVFLVHLFSSPHPES